MRIKKVKISTPFQARVAIYKKFEELSQETKSTRKQDFFRQKLQLMICRDDFQSEAKLLREKCGIPAEGFLDMESCIEWAGIISGQNKLGKKRCSLNEKIEALKAVDSEYIKSFKDLLRNFGIKERWENVVEYYILFDRIDIHELLPKSVEVRIANDEMTGESSLTLKIGCDTELRDILDEWSTVEYYQGIIRAQRGLDLISMTKETRGKLDAIDIGVYVKKQKQKKDRGRDDTIFEKQLRAYELRREGKSYSEIAKEIFGKTSYYDKVGIYIKRIKDAIKSVSLD